MPRIWRMGGSHERVHQWSQNRTRAEDNQRAQNEQQDDEGNEPPLFLLPEKQHEFFEKLPHGCSRISIFRIRSKAPEPSSFPTPIEFITLAPMTPTADYLNQCREL